MTDAPHLRRSDWGWLALAIAWLAATAWMRALALPDEGRYVSVSWEMLRSGDWITPTLDGLPYFHKPPLFYWITAASLSVFGMNEWAARVAPLVGGALGAASIYLFALRHADRSLARLALGIFATQPLVFVSSQYANTDMLVAGCITATLALAAHVALSPPSKERSLALVLAYAFAGLGVLAKGLIGAVLPGAVVVAWALLVRRPRVLLQLLSLPGLAVFLAVAVPWIAANEIRFPGFAHYFIVVQHFSRFAQTGFNNAQPVWFFPVVLALTALPWSLWLVPAGRLRFWRDEARGAVRLFMWTWIVVITAFFSLPQSKLIGYILPVAAPLAFLAADVAQGLGARGLKWTRACAALAVLACLGVAIGTSVKPLKSHRELGLALRAAGPQDGIVYLQEFFFDIPFYAQLRQPFPVLDHWDNPKRMQGDTWRRELADAAAFDRTGATARRVLAKPADLPSIVCAHPATWMVGSRDMKLQYPLLKSAQLVARQGDAALWRITDSAAGCDPQHGTPAPATAPAR